MPTKQEYLVRARQILAVLAMDAIQLGKAPLSAQDRVTNAKLKELRKATSEQAQALPMAGLTSSLALTYLKVAACQEMAQRFAFEYMRVFQDQQVSLVFMANPDNLVHDNHVLVLIGPVRVDAQLIIAQGNQEAIVNIDANRFCDATTFFRAQAQAVLVDPFLQCAAYANDPVLPTQLSDYCRQESISQVVAVKLYRNTYALLDNLAVVDRNALRVAAAANNDKNLYYLNCIRQALFPIESANWFFIASANRFGLVGDKDFLTRLQAIFAENHFTDNVRLSETTQGKIPVLLIEHATTLDLAKVMMLTNAIGTKVLAEYEVGLAGRNYSRDSLSR